MTPPPPKPNKAFDDDLLARLAKMTLTEKCELLTGKTHWRTYARPSIRLHEIVVSDGPTGIRGEELDTGESSISLPSPTAVAATWDRDLARQAGCVHAIEARRHGTHVILAPVVNLQRTPVAGRHFEYQSEDPVLTGDIAVAIIDGIQGQGIGACVKHFVCNDSETLRTQYLARIDERTLREVYLAPFERATIAAHAWSVMASYNRVDDGVEAAPAVAHHRLLTQVLKDEWGYDGLVVSDWTATKTTVEPAVGGLDLVMPGPAGPWSSGQLQRAVEDGLVSESHINDKVLRLLLLARRVGALKGGPRRPQPAPGWADDDLIRTLAARAVVVLADADGSLPVTAPSSIALIGPNAVDTFVQGGGSALVNPAHTYTAEQAFREAFPRATVTVMAGAHARLRPPLAAAATLRDPIAGRKGIHVEALADDGQVLAEKTWTEPDIFRRDALPAGTSSVRLTTDIRLRKAGEHLVGAGAPGAFGVIVNGEEIAAPGEPITSDEVFLQSQHRNVPFAVTTVAGGSTARVVVQAQAFGGDNWGSFVRAVVLHNPPERPAAESIAEAAALAASVTLPVVIVGTNEAVESEGYDRLSLDLPGDQNALVEAVLAVRPDAVIVINAGSPVLLPWLDRARTVLWTWFPGQEGGRPIADVLCGRTEPSGRLPWTLPARWQDVPVPDARPAGPDLVVDYREGVDVGYRGWLRLGRVPARPFGYGLGWTTWQYDDAYAEAHENGADVVVTVTNTGLRYGHETVQVYLSGPGDGRPVRWLAGFAGTDIDSGDSAVVVVHLPRRVFEVWDTADHCWRWPSGRYTVDVGHDLADIRASLTLDHQGDDQ